MRTFEIQGRLINVEGFQVSGNFVIEVSDDREPQYISFYFENSIVWKTLKSFKNGDVIKVAFEIKGTEHEGKFDTVLQAQSVNAVKKFKYQSEIESHQLTNCPPKEYHELETHCYRFVFEDIAHPNNFMPALLINPERINDTKGYYSKCKGFGLSLFVNESGARESHERFMAKTNGKFAKIVGDYLASIQLIKQDGVGSEPEHSNFSHFTFHEYSSADFATKVIRHYKI